MKYIKSYGEENDIEKLLLIMDKEKFKLTNIVISHEFTQDYNQAREAENKLKQLQSCIKLLNYYKTRYDYLSDISEFSFNSSISDSILSAPTYESSLPSNL